MIRNHFHKAACDMFILVDFSSKTWDVHKLTGYREEGHEKRLLEVSTIKSKMIFLNKNKLNNVHAYAMQELLNWFN